MNGCKVSANESGIPTCELQKGQLAVFIKTEQPHNLGRIVVRAGDRIQVLNAPDWWPASAWYAARVRVLKPGECVTIS